MLGIVLTYLLSLFKYRWVVIIRARRTSIVRANLVSIFSNVEIVMVGGVHQPILFKIIKSRSCCHKFITYVCIFLIGYCQKTIHSRKPCQVKKVVMTLVVIPQTRNPTCRTSRCRLGLWPGCQCPDLEWVGNLAWGNLPWCRKWWCLLWVGKWWWCWLGFREFGIP